MPLLLLQDAGLPFLAFQEVRLRGPDLLLQKVALTLEAAEPRPFAALFLRRRLAVLDLLLDDRLAEVEGRLLLLHRGAQDRLLLTAGFEVGDPGLILGLDCLLQLQVADAPLLLLEQEPGPIALA